MEAQLSSPGELHNWWWHVELPLLERGADARGMAGVMHRLTEDVPQQAIAGFGNWITVLLGAAGAFGRHSTGVRHELWRGPETVQITSFRNNADGRHKADPAERLQRSNEGHLPTRFGALSQRALQAFDAFTGSGHFRQIVSEDHAIGQVFELDLPKPLKVAMRPVPHSNRSMYAQPQEKLAQTMFRSELVNFGVSACPDQVAERLMLSIRYPDRREIATAQQPRQLERIASIRLDLVARTRRYRATAPPPCIRCRPW